MYLEVSVEVARFGGKTHGGVEYTFLFEIY